MVPGTCLLKKTHDTFSNVSPRKSTFDVDIYRYSSSISLLLTFQGWYILDVVFHFMYQYSRVTTDDDVHARFAVGTCSFNHLRLFTTYQGCGSDSFFFFWASDFDQLAFSAVKFANRREQSFLCETIGDLCVRRFSSIRPRPTVVVVWRREKRHAERSSLGVGPKRPSPCWLPLVWRRRDVPSALESTCLGCFVCWPSVGILAQDAVWLTAAAAAAVV